MGSDLFKKLFVFGTMMLLVATGFLSSASADFDLINYEDQQKLNENLYDICPNGDTTPIGFRIVEFFCGRITNVLISENHLNENRG